MHRPTTPQPGFDPRVPTRKAAAPTLRLADDTAHKPSASRHWDRTRESRPRHVDVRAASQPESAPRPQHVVPLTGPTDPRWVLAVRVGEQLEGEVLRPEKRQRLMKLGRVLGLSAFDATLVIAIVQDQARRGYAPGHCPAAAEAQLTMVRLPGGENDGEALRARRRRRVIMFCWVAVILVVEVVVLSGAL
jgi:hypothetical protein